MSLRTDAARGGRSIHTVEQGLTFQDFSRSIFYLCCVFCRSEYGAFRTIFRSGFYYVLTQFAKQLVLITNVFDIAGITYVLSNIRTLTTYPPQLRILAVGLGWAFAEAIISYLAPLWIGARGVEFDWANIQMGMRSNVGLLRFVSFAACGWLWTRRDLSRASTSLVAAMFAVFTFIDAVLSYERQVIEASSWSVLLTEAVVYAALSVGSYAAYQGYMVKLREKQKR